MRDRLPEGWRGTAQNVETAHGVGKGDIGRIRLHSAHMGWLESQREKQEEEK